MNVETFRFAFQLDKFQCCDWLYVLVHNAVMLTPSFLCLCFIQIEAIVSPRTLALSDWILLIKSIMPQQASNSSKGRTTFQTALVLELLFHTGLFTKKLFPRRFKYFEEGMA